MNKYHLIKQPRAVRKARLDNLAVVPASLLPFKEQWQEVANSQPGEHVLIILPTSPTPQRNVLERVAHLLEAKGHQVTTLSAADWLSHAFGQYDVDADPRSRDER